MAYRSAEHPAGDRVVLCAECDWLMRLPARELGQSAHCPRCHHHVAEAAQPNAQQPLAWAIASLLMLALVFVFPFLGFSSSGVGHVMDFVDSARSLIHYHYGELAAVVLATTVVLPALYLAALVYLYGGIQLGRRLPGSVAIARTLRPLEPWMMSDVFIVGVLVSLIKIMSLADIHIRTGFVVFCIYSVMLIRTLTLVDWTSLWDAIAPAPSMVPVIRGASGRSQGVVACTACHTPFVINRGHCCPRCGKRHRAHAVNRLQLTWALLATAVILFIPANLYPVLYTVQLGNPQPQTIAAGVLGLWHHGDWPIALVIFTASIVVPLSKIIALAWLCIKARATHMDHAMTNTRLYRMTEKIGRWSMIDVFVVSILGALVHAGSLISIRPGVGTIPFAGVVIVTMVAALTFDTRLLWPDTSRRCSTSHTRDPIG
ncbi:MAG: paraquat-inducible protein A [Salinisphaera sp.]|jgi:paraquat-inducible protein A|nr:paraquat-inducible protein A [Salinisphaera sp.]